MKQQVGGLTFNSDFDSGNLGKVELIDGSENEFLCNVRRDCEGTPHANTNSSWFYFEVSGGRYGQSVVFHMKTLNVQAKLYSFDMRPVVKKGRNGKWKRISQKPQTHVTSTQQFIISWSHTFDDEPVRFAFTYPYPYKDLCRNITNWEQRARSIKKITFEKSVIATTLEGRNLDALHITSSKGRESEKRIVFLTARVHAGETPASHILHGFINSLFDTDNVQASYLLDNFVFKIIPMLNPDGVAKGFYRTDTNGLNLNRMYETPKPERHPTIHATRRMFLSLFATGRLCLYIDFHAHATRRGCFIYGNALHGDQQVENLLFPKLLSLNTDYFDYQGCNFTQKNMRTKGKFDGLSKKGTGRVALHSETGFVSCYTLEVNYNTGMPSDRDSCVYPYTPEIYESIGAAVGGAVLDKYGLNPICKLTSTPYQNLEGVKTSLSRSIRGNRSVYRIPRAKTSVSLPTISKADYATSPFRAHQSLRSFKTGRTVTCRT